MKIKRKKQVSGANLLQCAFPSIFSLAGLAYFEIFLFREGIVFEILFFAAYSVLVLVLLPMCGNISPGFSFKLCLRAILLQIVVIYFSNVFVAFVLSLPEFGTSPLPNILKFVFLGALIFTAWRLPFALAGVLLYCALLFGILSCSEKVRNK